jgi:hypothetical protein
MQEAKKAMNYYPAGIEPPGGEPGEDKKSHKRKLSQFQIKLIAVIFAALVIITALLGFYITDKILNPELFAVILKPSLEYDHIFCISGGDDLLLAVILDDQSQSNARVGLIDRRGNIIAPLIYDWIDGFYECGMARAGKDGKTGLINKSGEIVAPLIYDWIGAFSEGLAAAGKDGKYGFIDKSGNTVIDFIYDWANDFQEGLAFVSYENKVGLIDKTGEAVIPFIYDASGDRAADYGLIVVGKSYRPQRAPCIFGIIDAAGNIIAPFEYEWIFYNAYSGHFEAAKDNQRYFISTDGEIAVAAILPETENEEYSRITPLPCGELRIAQRRVDSKWGIIDADGELALPFIYNFIRHIGAGLFQASKGGEPAEWGVIDAAGNIIAPFEYARHFIFTEGLILARKMGPDGLLKVGYLDMTGEIAIPFIYYSAGSFDENGLAIVSKIASKNRRWGIINKTGEAVIPFIYDQIDFDAVSERFLSAQKRGKWGIIDMNGNGRVVLPFKYDEIRACCVNENLLFVLRNGKWGILEIKKVV